MSQMHTQNNERIYFPKMLFGLKEVQTFKLTKLQYPLAWKIVDDHTDHVLKLDWKLFIKNYARSAIGKQLNITDRIKRRKYWNREILDIMNRRKK